jgi:hypothetical protein
MHLKNKFSLHIPCTFCLDRAGATAEVNEVAVWGAHFTVFSSAHDSSDFG